MALAVDPGAARALYGKGLVANRHKDWPQARVYLDSALSLEPDLQEAHYELGVSHRGSNDPDRAEVEFRRALEQQPGDILSRGQLASLFRERGDHTRAGHTVGAMRVQLLAAGWQGPYGGNLAWAGSCWQELDLHSGEVEIVVTASGTPAAGIWPLMILTLDGNHVASSPVKGQGDYAFRTRVGWTGRHRLAVAFANDSTSDEQGDRNLAVKGTVIRYIGVD